ncbi:MAG: DUF4815 domain-containing protein [Patescibacteria group bacterium]|nr:DUF4815 domain-containing protein [Patescibacteria group bacterium]
MSVIKQLKASPYFDDYDPEVKDFLRVLFKPGRAVQTRELNQLQSILQMQVERFANHVFKDGSIVYGGGTTIDTISARYLKIEDNVPNTSNPVNLSSLVGKRLRGKSSGAVVLVTTFVDREGADPKVLIVKNLNGVSFNASEILEVVVQDSSGNYIPDSGFPSTGIAKLLSGNFYGKASTVSISDGIFFTKGMFVICNSQTVALDKFSNTPNKKAGLISEIQFVSENEDQTLLDNAAGTYNYSAPGASRLKIILTLTCKDVNYTPSPNEDFIELLETREGKLYKQITRPTYNELMKMLARRTYNESGNYTVRPFILTLEDHPTDNNKLRATLSPGLAYINGFEMETIAPQTLDINKALDTDSVNNYGISIYYENYFLVKRDTANGFPNFNLFTEYKLRNASNADVGTCYIRSIENNPDIPATYKLFVFNIKMSGSYTISDVKKVFASGEALFEIYGSNTVLYGPSQNSLVYNTGFKVQDMSDIVVTYKKTFSNYALTGGVATINLTGNEEFYPDTSSYIVFEHSTGNHKTVTNVMLLNNNQTAQVTVSGTTANVTIITNVRNRNANRNLKTPVYVRNSRGYVSQAVTNTNIIKLASGEPNISGFYNNCKIKFISGTGAGSTLYTISSYNETTKEVTISGGPVNVGTDTYYEIVPEMNFTTTDLTRGFYVHTLSSNLNDQTYIQLTGMYDGISLVKVIKNATTYEDWFDPSKDITYLFEFNNGQTNDFYGPCKIKLSTGNSLPSGTKLHIFVNRFTHTINDGFFNCNSYPASINTMTYIDADGNTINLKDCVDFRPTFDGTSFLTPSKIPKAYSLMSADIVYYLGKMVKIVATADEKFVVIEGVSSLTPKPPADVDYGMTLYVLNLAPFTLNKNYVSVKYIENKRYTMRDIGKLEKRIEDIEYYTSLSLLESDATALDVKDPNGLTRVKNGIMVDSFRDHSVGDGTNPDYRCSVDLINNELRPQFIQRAFSLYPLTNTGMTIENGFAVKSYTMETFISQTKASKKVNINPYAIFLWRGKVTLNPPTDIWKDTRTSPVPLSASNQGNNTVTVPWSCGFNDWVDEWVGGEDIIEEEVEWVVNDALETWSGFFYSPFVSYRISHTDPITGATVNPPLYLRYMRNPDGTEVLHGMGSALRKVSKRVVGRTEDQRVRRKREGQSGQITITQTATNLGDVVVKVNNIPYIRSRSVQFTVTGMKPNTRVYVFFDDVNVMQHITSSSNPLTTDGSGSVSGTFNIPANKFLTGERVFRVTDSPTNNREEETTFAEARYYAQGLEEEKATLMINVPQVNVTTNNTSNTAVQPVDPLAQSFFVDPIIYPEGIFVKEVDIFFAKKDNAIPVILQIRENVNGYPSNVSIVSEVLKNASAVNVSANGSVATTFTFPNPIYLKPGEYSLVLISNSDNYEVWVAKIGENEIISNTIISEQPYVGSLFKSQNASTWTAEQTEDLKFVIRKCAFTTGGYELILSDFVSTNETDITTTSTVFQPATSGTQTLYLSHLTERNIVVGSELIHTAIPSGTKITAVNAIENKVTLSAAITANISSGTQITVRRKAEANSESNRMDVFKANVSVFNPFSTADASYSFLSKLWDQTTLESVYTPLNINNNFEFSSPRKIDIAKESFRMRIIGTVRNRNVSPVFNLNRNYIVSVENIINSPTTVSETGAVGGNCFARYITKKMVLEDSSTYLRVFFDLYRPVGTNVKVFYRSVDETDQSPIESKTWIELNSLSNLTNIFSNRPNDFFEVAWSPSTVNINPFVELQIKIVLLSDNTSRIPKIKRLRVLALD